jgi:hypothetical protein
MKIIKMIINTFLVRLLMQKGEEKIKGIKTTMPRIIRTESWM